LKAPEIHPRVVDKGADFWALSLLVDEDVNRVAVHDFVDGVLGRTGAASSELR
jgi:hypothetical protein